ncbi:hypothetical protein MIR68_008297 [Amoeboaphelidium protococcarum]|nr:hypothetical protein MIR68_008297 [Amoeboaphelidium protococcarum]KAI3644520.1 hypothetical protein MP228_010684 [Amoeboaphelidium protococcarum]
MFRNQYDNDVTTFSPQGRLHQLEYAMEAVKQGSATVAVKSKDYAVVVCLRRKSGELGSWQEKIIRIDDHVGLSYSGLSSDARLLSNSMRTSALQSKMLFQSPISTFKLVSRIADKAQSNTQGYGSRPFGVGFLVVSYDDGVPHIYEFMPSGNVFDYYANAIGGRSQSCRTYLEKHFDKLEQCNLDQLINHALLALREAIPAASSQASGDDKDAASKKDESEMKPEDVGIAIVGKDRKFAKLSDSEVERYVVGLPENTSRATAATTAMDVDQGGAAPMEVE